MEKEGGFNWKVHRARLHPREDGGEQGVRGNRSTKDTCEVNNPPSFSHKLRRKLKKKKKKLPPDRSVWIHLLSTHLSVCRSKLFSGHLNVKKNAVVDSNFNSVCCLYSKRSQLEDFIFTFYSFLEKNWKTQAHCLNERCRSKSICRFKKKKKLTVK